MNCFKNIIVGLIISFILVSPLAAQPTLVNAPVTNIKFDQIGLEQGLSQSTVYAIVQDKQGFMWFGTQDGLNRYDGYSIKVYNHDPNDSNSISNNMFQVCYASTMEIYGLGLLAVVLIGILFQKINFTTTLI